MRRGYSSGGPPYSPRPQRRPPGPPPGPPPMETGLARDLRLRDLQVRRAAPPPPQVDRNMIGYIERRQRPLEPEPPDEYDHPAAWLVVVALFVAGLVVGLAAGIVIGLNFVGV